MTRTVVSLDDDDKRWLDERAKEEGVAMTELVRRAVKRYRQESDRQPFHELLEAVRGTWKHGDGLAWQRRLRSERDERSP